MEIKYEIPRLGIASIIKGRITVKLKESDVYKNTKHLKSKIEIIDDKYPRSFPNACIGSVPTWPPRLPSFISSSDLCLSACFT
jgi:hypothetical protein